METTLTQEEPFDGRAATELAIGCFTIGTLFFILFLTLQDTSFILIIGFIFIVLASILNIIMLTNLLYHFYIQPQQRKYIGTKILMLLSNIPIAFLYFGIIIYLACANSPF
ncbi:hypothetical protein [Flavobacterium aquicola]|uniref:Uncharacterized protein n=1 Tax=Flavobacterium aquicola TaxID=1682742 RepID=A0A3E0EQY3_9FLAO|nr:hypothetical protein [Flavobacterium aquicola]REG99779.1 hypothetical protein C8P67_104415 [Flavobacterium aquicola]